MAKIQIAKLEKNKRAMETAIALCFGVALISFIFGKERLGLLIILAATFIALVGVAPYLWLSVIWFGLGNVLGRLFAPFIMAGVYLLVLCPSALIYRLFRRQDPLCIKRDDERQSSFTVIDKTYEPDDFRVSF